MYVIWIGWNVAMSVLFLGICDPSITRWWQLKYCLFSPLFGEDSQFDEHIFQMGWFNHQVDNITPLIWPGTFPSTSFRVDDFFSQFMVCPVGGSWELFTEPPMVPWKNRVLEDVETLSPNGLDIFHFNDGRKGR